MPLAMLQTSSPALDLAGLPAADVAAIYVHVPFCFHKCHYCDFYSITRQTPQRMSRFVELILREAAAWRGARQIAVAPRTLFIGGGTPTLLPLEMMADLLDRLRRIFDLSHVDEWTIEANPATVTPAYCRILRSHGVNRLSFGAQSFAPEDLKLLERHHEPADVARSLEMARSAGFERLNLDLIYAIPGQSLDSWKSSLETGLALGTSHLSCYGLTYEPNTPLAVRRRMGKVQPAREELELEMMRHTRATLTASGLPAYEISNYARPGQACRHNLAYWTGANYIALGPGGASHLEGRRWRNRPHLGEWERALDAGELPAIEFEQLSPSQRAGELAMLMLRLSSGVQFEIFQHRLGHDPRHLWADLVARFRDEGLLWLDNQAFGLSDRGLAIADAIAAEFLDPDLPAAT